jgi:hypothetical protein
LNRKQAVKLLNVALGRHKFHTLIEYVDLIEPQNEFEGYQLRIKSSNDENKEHIKSHLEEFGITAKEENDILIIT